MDNSYYVPELGEFRLGLEYEFVHESGMLVQRAYESSTPFSYIQEKLDENTLRVKLLDEDDVTSLDFQKVWNPTTETTGELLFLHPSNYSLTLRYGATSAYVVLKHNEDPLAMPYFSGMCKNKRTLQDIVSYLGIHSPTSYEDN